MRIKSEVADLNYNDTKSFFKKRAEKFQRDNPYAVTMYQDNDADLVKERNKREIEKLRPKLKLSEASRVFDLACGIGRWADALPDEIAAYCGVDFSRELIEIANKRNTRKNFLFYEGTVNEIENTLLKNKTFNTILMIGILMYLNDDDLFATLTSVERICDERAVVCIREPIGILERLTLKNFFSEELEDNYNAIYRTKEELMSFFSRTFMKKGFCIRQQGFLFDEDGLNNRKETAQYYFLLER